MIATLILGLDQVKRQEKAEEILTSLNLNFNSPDVLLFSEEKFGVEESKKVLSFLQLKSYAGKNQAVLIQNADKISTEAQNSLLKTLEEHPENVAIILGSSTEDLLLPTIISRCQVIRLEDQSLELSPKAKEEIEILLGKTLEERFIFVEKLKDKEQFLKDLVLYFREQIKDKPNLDFLNDLLQAEKWAKQYVNIRAILEYLMLKMP